MTLALKRRVGVGMGGGGGGRRAKDNRGVSVGASLSPRSIPPVAVTPLLGRGREGLWLPVSHPGTCKPCDTSQGR